MYFYFYKLYTWKLYVKNNGLYIYNHISFINVLLFVCFQIFFYFDSFSFMPFMFK